MIPWRRKDEPAFLTFFRGVFDSGQRRKRTTVLDKGDAAVQSSDNRVVLLAGKRGALGSTQGPVLGGPAPC
jgi:hypothetical protein